MIADDSDNVVVNCWNGWMHPDEQRLLVPPIKTSRQSLLTYDFISDQRMAPQTTHPKYRGASPSPGNKTAQSWKDNNDAHSTTVSSISTEQKSNAPQKNRPFVSRSATDIAASCSNLTERSRSFVRRCSSTTSVASGALSLMLDQLNRKGISLPSKDYKILELMVTRHEQFLQEMNLRTAVHDSWEAQRILDNEDQIQEEIRRREHLRKKRHTEELLREYRREIIQRQEDAEIEYKQETRNEKERKWKMLWEQQEKIRQEAIRSMKTKESQKKLAQEDVLRRLKENEERVKEIIVLDRNYRLIRSVQSRQCQEMEAILKLRKTNMNAEDKHKVLIQELKKQFREKLTSLIDEIEERDDKVKKNIEVQAKLRETKLKQESAKREARTIKAQRIYRQTDEQSLRLAQELEKVWLEDHLMAEQRAHQAMTERKCNVRKKRLQKTIQHKRKMNSVINEERRRMMVTIESVRQKNNKSSSFAVRRKEEIQKSRNVARASSDLRQRLKDLLHQEILGQRINLSDLQLL